MDNRNFFKMQHYFPGMNIQKLKILLLLGVDELSQIFRILRSGILFILSAKDGDSVGKQKRLDYFHGVTDF